MTPTVSVVVPTRDRASQLAACLAALEAQTATEYEVVVVDDGSLDAGAVAAVVEAAPHARLVAGEGRGPAAARNAGARAALAPVLCFTDDDCRPEPEWVEAMERRIAAGASSVAGPTRNGKPGDVWSRASQTITNHLSESSVDPSTGALGFAPTSNVACTAAVHVAVPFDETYPLAAGEDRDWCARIAQHGFALMHEPCAVVWHHQDLSLRRFWRQQERYGRGAHHWRQRAAAMNGVDAGMQPARFYRDLVARGLRLGPSTAATVVLAQLATAVGLAAETARDRKLRPSGPRGSLDVSAPPRCRSVRRTSSWLRRR